MSHIGPTLHCEALLIYQVFSIWFSKSDQRQIEAPWISPRASSRKNNSNKTRTSQTDKVIPYPNQRPITKEPSMSEVIKNCIAHCKTTPNKLILPEGEDPRVQSAAIKIKEQGIASPILIGNAEQITKAASQANNNLSAIEIIDSEQQAPDNQREILIGKKRKITNETVDDYIQLPIYRAVSMLHSGEADAFVAGAVLPTAKVLEASFAVGPKPGIETHRRTTCRHSHHISRKCSKAYECGTTRCNAVFFNSWQRPPCKCQ